MKKYKVQEYETFIEIRNLDGSKIGLSKKNKDKVIEVDGYIFKNLKNSNKLEPYNDWRLSPEVRAKDLAQKLSVTEIAGLMLYSKHQTVTKNASKYEKLFGQHTYSGKPYAQTDCSITELSDQQKEFLEKDHVRHVLVSTVDSKEECAMWVNQLQSYCEDLGYGIPVNVCSDPRHGVTADAEYNLGSGSDISKWPEEIGLAATFDPKIVERFGFILSEEYRGLGITTALSPQIDLASDPRWKRFNGTFGSHSTLCAEMAKAYCDGVQTSTKEAEIREGWGWNSVNTMVKHWPGGGSGEGGRDAHNAFGKYAVYPGDNFHEHLKPFLDGAFQLDGKTKKASALMPYYTISYDQDVHYHENVGNSYSRYIIQDLLRDKYKYDGVVCTDWLITADHGPTIGTFSGKCWGVENLSVAQRHYKALQAGVDQFGGNNDIRPVLQAYKMLEETYGTEYALQRFQTSAYRILKNMFQVGLFDQPYLDIEETKQIVGCSEFMKEGYEAQVKSIILLKNKNNILPIKRHKKVYIPTVEKKEKVDWFGNTIKASSSFPINKELLSSYYEIVDQPEEADFSIVCMNSPVSDGYTEKDGIGKYIPISLQYRPYQCLTGREISIAKGDPLEDCDRSYLGNTAMCENEHELDMLLETKKRMKDKPVICCIHMKRPSIVSELDQSVDGLLVHSGVQNQAILDIISGAYEPSGCLPFHIPKDMNTVEQHSEDVPFDIEPYKDEEGNLYEFAYGRTFSGLVQHPNVNKYRK